MVNRVKFPGDPVIQETGTGQAPQMPLNRNVAQTSVEMLNKTQRGAANQEADDDEDQDEADLVPEYSRERIGARIGEPLEQAQAVDAIEHQLDEEDDQVPLLFPVKVKLQDKGIMHEWAQGVHMVPISLAGKDKKSMHWWLKSNGVRRAGAPQPNPNKVPAE